MAVIYGVSLFVLIVVLPGTVTLLKGQYLIFAIGLFVVGLVWPVASFRLARPDSWWATHIYPHDSDKIVRSRLRYGTENLGT